MRGLTRSSAAVLAAALLFSAGVLAARGNKDGPVAVSRGEAVVSAAETEQGSGLIDINSAGAEELDLLPGIGPAKAAAILEYREQHGPFLEPDGLLEVPGIGETLFGDIADYICVDAQEEDP